MWSFNESSNWSVKTTPKYEDFFIDTDTSVAENLVREVTQNAGDACLTPDGTVTVLFRFGKISRKRFKERYMARLEIAELIRRPERSYAGRTTA